MKTQTLLIKKSVITGLQKNSHKLSITIRQAFEGFVGSCPLIKLKDTESVNKSKVIQLLPG